MRKPRTKKANMAEERRTFFMPRELRWTKEPTEPFELWRHRRDRGRCVGCGAPAEADLGVLGLDSSLAAWRAYSQGVTLKSFQTRPLCADCRAATSQEVTLPGWALVDLGYCPSCGLATTPADRPAFDPAEARGNYSAAMRCASCRSLLGPERPMDIAPPHDDGECPTCFLSWLECRAVWDHDWEGGCERCPDCLADILASVRR